MIGDAILLALRELRRNLLRALLTTLGIVIGVASVIAIVTLGNGATAQITNSIGALGSNVLILTPGAQRGFGPPMHIHHDAAEAFYRGVLGLEAIGREAGRHISCGSATASCSPSSPAHPPPRIPGI